METTTENAVKNDIKKVMFRTDIMSFLNKAKNKDKFRTGLDFYFVEDGYMFTTDGRRAHRVSAKNYNISLENGAYTFCCTSKGKMFSEFLVSKENATIPALKKVWPLETELVLEGYLQLSNDEHDLTSALIKIYTKTGRAINIKYIKDLHYEAKFTQVSVNAPKGFIMANDKPLIFKVSGEDNVQALILPLRVEVK